MSKSITLSILLAVLLISCRSEQHAEAEVSRLLATSESWNGVSLPEYPEGQPRITVLRVTIPPNTELPVHKHPVISAGVVLQGELTVTTDTGETLRLKAGDAVSEVVNTWHYGKNSGSEPAEIIVFYAGADETPITAYEESDED